MVKKFLDLGRQPIANGFLKNEVDFKDEFFFNLSLGFDDETKLVSLVEFVDKDLLFNENYLYFSSVSRTMSDHFLTAAEFLKRNFDCRKLLEIGSNDGIFLKNFTPDQIVAVEPCSNFASLTNNIGYQTYDDFWDLNLSEKILNVHGPFSIVYSANCMCHIQNLEEAFDAINHILDDDGIFIFEDPSLAKMMERVSYDQVYDEHAHIFSVTALSNLLSGQKMEIFKVEDIAVHGGSNRIYVKKMTNNSISIDGSVKDHILFEKDLGLNEYETYAKFSEKVMHSKNELVSLLKTLKSENKKIIGYGATSKSTVIFNYCNITTDYLDYMLDTTVDKQAKFSPGVHIPVVSPEDGIKENVDYAFLGAWNYEKEILQKESNFVERGGKFITHIPNVRIM